jgi:hypothetical protein
MSDAPSRRDQVRVKRVQTIHGCGVDVARGLVLLFGIGTSALPSWDFEDEAEQSNGRPCRLTNGRSKRTCELTSSVVPRGTSFHRLVELGFPPIAFDPAWLSCCCGFFPSPAELRAVNPDAVPNRKKTLSRFRRRDLRGRFEIRCQACSASSNALASFRSSVSKP